MKIPFVEKTPVALLLVAGCTSVSTVAGGFVPSGWTEYGENGPKIETVEATVYAEGEDGAKLSDNIENQGDLQQLVLDMPETEAALNEMLTGLAQHWPYETPQPAKVKMSMLSEYSGATYADGTILIGLGTFAPIMPSIMSEEAAQAPTISSDEELKYLLAHEYAHYALGHHSKTDALSELRAVTGNLTKIYNTASVLQEVRYEQSANGGQLVVQDQNAVAQDIEKAIGTFDLIGALSTRGLSPAWNRGQEDEADVLALDLIKAEGINAPVYEAMFQALSEHQSLSEKFTAALEGSVSEVQAQALTPANLRQALNGNAQAVGGSIFDTAKKSFARSVRKSVIEHFGQTHRPPQVRLEGVQRYELAAYPEVTAESRDEAAFMEPQTTEVIDMIRSLEEFREARDATVAYYSAIDKRMQGDYAAAELIIQSALATRFSDQAAIQFEAGRVAEFGGSPELAKTRYRAAIAATPLPAAYRKLARLETRTGKYADAELIISEGEDRLGDAEYFLPSRINLAVARQDIDLAMTLVSRCRSTQRPDLMAACEASHAGIDPSQMTLEQKQFFERQGQIGVTPSSELMEGLGDLFGGS